MNIEGVAAVVTGAASGLGEATARELARRGAKVAIFDRDASRGEQVATDIGGIFCEVDVTSDERVAVAFGTNGNARANRKSGPPSSPASKPKKAPDVLNGSTAPKLLKRMASADAGAAASSATTENAHTAFVADTDAPFPGGWRNATKEWR